MSRRIASYNRKWTRQLVERLRKDVDALALTPNSRKGGNKKEAFKTLVPVWNLSSRTIGQVYFGTGNFSKYPRVPTVAQIPLPPIETIQKANAEPTDLVKLVTMLKAIGGTVTFTI